MRERQSTFGAAKKLSQIPVGKEEVAVLKYYYFILVLTWASLVLLSVLVFENDRMSVREKRIHWLTYLIVALAALSEGLGVAFSGDPTKPTWVIRLVKCFDYMLTPIAGGALVNQLHNKTVVRKIILGVLAANLVFQFVAVFTNWMIVIDTQNVYSHGRAYFVYVGFYISIIILALIEFVLYGRKFRNQNKVSLYLTIIFVFSGIVMQEAAGVRVAYVAIAIGMAMMYIHNAEFAQLSADDSLREQRIQIMLSQIRPHFIYNSLSSIAYLCETDPKRARNLTHDFAEYLRGQLDAIESERLMPFEKVLEQVGFYTELEKARFGDRVKLAYDIRANDFSLPTMSLQPLVENAIRYGICKKEKGGTIRITSYETFENFVVEVKDDGVGFDVQSVPAGGRSHIGIKNVRERLATYGDRLEIESKIGVGTTATIIVPKKNSEEKK
ncbi:MAG: histidine kinase [Clostridia bacterium]|nr:histidine kinase [Clostridia bacterium]